MKAPLTLILALALLEAASVFAAKPSASEPSVQLRHLIDTTLSKLTSISDSKQKPIDRTALIEAQADFTAKALTAPPAQQAMYQNALHVVTSLVGAIEEHEKAVADFQYSKSVHGKQDREDAKVAIWQRGAGQGKAAEADNSKQKMENAASRKALLDKEKFMEEGAAAAWTQRVGQIHATIEQTLITELVAEKQLAMLTPATPPPLPSAPKPESKPPKEISAAEKYSPVGEWKAVNPANRSATLKEDNTVTGHGKKTSTGTWKWTDQSKGALAINWSDGIISNVILSRDGRTMDGKANNGHDVNFTRATSPPATEAVAAETASAPPPAIAEIMLDADPAKGLSGHGGKAVGISAENARKFRLQPGLKDPSLVSLEALGLKGFYLRHQRGVLFLHERPNEDHLFEADATFKLVHLDGDKVRFESSNYPGTFITVKDDGSVVVIRDPSPTQSIFVLKAE